MYPAHNVTFFHIPKRLLFGVYRKAQLKCICIQKNTCEVLEFHSKCVIKLPHIDIKNTTEQLLDNFPACLLQHLFLAWSLRTCAGQLLYKITSVDARPGSVRTVAAEIRRFEFESSHVLFNAGRAPSGYRTMTSRCHFTLIDHTLALKSSKMWKVVPKLHRQSYVQSLI